MLHAGGVRQKESSPEPWQCPNPAKTSPGLEEDGPRTARDITFVGCSRAHAAALARGDEPAGTGAAGAGSAPRELGDTIASFRPRWHHLGGRCSRTVSRAFWENLWLQLP